MSSDIVSLALRYGAGDTAALFDLAQAVFAAADGLRAEQAAALAVKVQVVVADEPRHVQIAALARVVGQICTADDERIVFMELLDGEDTTQT
jgi:hypothetical protein